MKRSRLEEVLDECLSAYLDGRRSVEDSLSLYPDIRPQLEPLLETAIALAEAFREPQPSAPRQQRGLEEFLNSASVRRRARELTKDLNISRRLAVLRGPRLSLIAAVFALTFVAVAAAVTVFEDPSREATSQAGFVSPAAGDALISDLRQTQERLREMTFQGGWVSPRAIRELTEKTADLKAGIQGDALDERSRRELEQAIADQFVLLQLILSSGGRGDIAPAAGQALSQTQEVAQDLGVDLPVPPAQAPTPAHSPPAAPTQTPGRPATSSPQPSASATATPAAGETSTPKPPLPTPPVP